jgi:hypothetical protein
MSRSTEVGGKPTSDLGCSGCAIAIKFEVLAFAVLTIESRCDRAHQSLKAKGSTDAEFLTNDEIKDKLEMLDREYLKGREALTKMLNVHRAHRGIHQNRKEMERRSRVLKEAEERFL